MGLPRLGPTRRSALADFGRLLAAELCAREAAERDGRRLALLAEASEVLARSLDHEQTLAAFAGWAVGRLADWLVVYGLDDDGGLVGSTVECARPEQRRNAQRLVGRRPPTNGTNGFARVLAGEALLLPLVDDEALERQLGDDAEAIALWREAGITSSLLVPLEARGRVLGALCLMTADSGRRFDEADLRLAEELGRRVALAVENARLYEQAQQELERHRRIEEALRRSEEQYRLLFETSPIATVDLDSRFTSVNAAFAEALGCSREELLGRRLPDFVPPEHHDRLETARFEKFEGEQRPTTYEHDLVAGDGRRLTVEVATQVVREDGRPVGVQAVCRDVTGRSVAERALRAAEARYRMLVEGLPLVTFVHPVGRHVTPTYISPQVESLLGYPQEDWLDRADLFWELIHPDDAAELREAETRRISFNRFRLRARDGREVWIYGERRVVRDDDGRPLYVQGFWLDVTDQQRVEAELRESRELYRLVVENSRDMIGIFDPAGRFLFASPSFASVLGYEPEELVGRRAADFRHPDDPPTVSALAGQPEAPLTGVSVRHRLRHKDGHWLEVEGFAVPILDDAGSLRLIVGTGRDIGDRLRAEELAEQLRQAQKMEAIGRLAGGIAHDFNNLLTVISGYSELARIRTDVPAIHEAIDQVSAAARTASELTAQLLAFSRQQVVQRRPVDLGTLVRSSMVLIDRLVGEDVSLDLRVERDLPPTSADPSQIEQVLINLAANAGEAMPEGGSVSIEVKRLHVGQPPAPEHVGLAPGEYVVLSFADTGVGMDDDTRSRIFEPFFTTKDEGTGLGLATVHGIVTQSGGLIGVESAPGRGATFVLTFPAAAEEQPAAASAEERGGDLGGTQAVLVVEDEDAVRQLAAEVLTSHGYTVLPAASAEEALALVSDWARPLDLVLSDVMLPGLKGPSLVEEVQKLHPEARTIFTSGYAPALITERGVEADGTFLPKPFTATALAAKVREVLNDGVAQLPTARMRPDATRSRARRAAGA